ncbi:tyrosine-protein phosphatase Lar-like isoform X3 [Liolophura sinensis]|uniref:tyrosine-protein phosphatase Lar-like isoform X3 n=1 Tax=Liolophura sinensis TaxID=3198878 RepID=UPI0031587D86
MYMWIVLLPNIKTSILSSLVLLTAQLTHSSSCSGNHTVFRYIEYLEHPPKITQAPKDQNVAENHIVSFFCKASGNPHPSFHWTKNGRKINTKNRYLTQEMQHGSVLRIEAARAKRDDATFECVADNGLGEPARASAKLVVYPVDEDHSVPRGYPHISESPKLMAVEKGRPAMLRCLATGDPKPTVMWLKDMVPVDMSDPRLTILDSGNLQIERCQESDVGKYECVAENDKGVAYSHAASLYVKVRRVPPHFSIPPENTEVMPGGDVNLTCVAVGSPMPIVRWVQGAKEITQDDEVPVGRNILMLTDVRETKNYTCVASSDLGTIEHTAQIQVKALLNAPVGLSTSEVTATSVRLSWDSGNREPVMSYIIQYKPKNQKGGYTEKTDITDTESLVMGLTPFTVYEFRVVAVNKIGRGTPSMPTEVMTGELAPGSPPRNVMARPVSSTTVMVSWEEPEIPNGVIKGYKVFYTLSPDIPIVFWEHREVANNKLTSISNLKTNHTYTISVLAFSNIGQGPLSEPIQVMTTQGGMSRLYPVPLQPRNLHGEAITPNSISLTWTPPDESDTIESYQLYYNDSYFRQNVRISIDPSVAGFTLNDLTPDTVYHIQVSAKSKRGEGAKTPTIQVRTLPFVPGAPPQAVSGSPIDSRSIQVTWKPPPAEKQNGAITDYKIFYLENGEGANENADARIVRVGPEERSYVLSQLSKWTEYKIWLLASTNVGDGPKSPPILVRTDEDVPGEPKKVRLEAINSTAAFVEWQPPARNERNGLIRGYQVHYVPVDENETPIGEPDYHNVVDGDRTDAVVTGLEADTRYKFHVVAYTRKGDGIRSKARVVTTKGAVPTPPRNLNVELLEGDPPRVRLTWQRPKETYGVIDGYKVIWGKKGESYEEEVWPGQKYTYVTDILEKGSIYEFRVSAKNAVDFGQRAVKTVSTPDGVPRGAPQNFSAVGLSETSVKLSWDLPAKKLRNGEIIMYQITYNKLAEPINVEDLNITETSVEISGLEMNTDYVFQIKAFTSRGAGPWSNKLHFRTFGQMPPAPKNVKVQRATPTSLLVFWDEPSFPVAGYKVYYNMFALPNMDMWQSIEIGPYTVTEITGLRGHTIYAVCVQARSVDGRYGNLSNITQSTYSTNEKTRSDVVEHFHASSQTSRSISLKWDPPSKAGVNSYRLRLQGRKRYRDKYGSMQTVTHPLQIIPIPGSYKEYVVRNLPPKVLFSFNLSAIFQDATSGPEAFLAAETLIEAPPVVERPVMVGVESGVIKLKLSRASERNGPLSHYLLCVVQESKATKPPNDFTINDLTQDVMDVQFPASEPYIAARFEARYLQSEFELGNGQAYGSYVNRPLDRDQRYKVFLRAYSVDPKLYKSSSYSNPLSLLDSRYSIGPGKNPEVRVPVDRDPYDPVDEPIDPRNNPRNNAGQSRADGKDTKKLLTIVGPVCGVVVVLIIVALCVIMYRRKKSNRKEKSPEPTQIRVEVPAHPCDPVEMRRQNYQTPAMMNHPPIPIAQLNDHIDALKANDNYKFSQEYESIEPGQQFTWDNSSLEVNKPKNRYANVIAYDHSRVILLPIESLAGGDYINANYMDGYRKQNAYIATQGPLPETFGDFWRMVWEQRSATVVMMTKLEERSRIKCDQYWPSRGTEAYSVMHVTLVDVMELATYTIRTFQVARHGYPEKREVRQFQFTAWPDHGVPDHPTPLLMFMRRVKASNPPDAGPMVVHCSAGVGRTGAFIVIDSMLERIKHERTVDIYGHVTCLRAQRNYMVQTEDQYIFIHDALLEAVQTGHTEVPARNLGAHIQKLLQPDPGETVTGMELEFKRLANMKANPSRFVSANLPVNKFKNRLVNILPYESTRVCLQPIRGVDGSDYINASFIDGYRYKKAYVATQGPLVETTEDFWRMLWEHNSTIIVMLTKLREMGREKCHQYWPSERSARYQYFVVDPMAEYNMPQYILREFKVTDARDGQSRTVRQFQFTDWPEQGVPKSGEGFIDFIGQVHKTKEQFGQDGPISVHCSAGVGRTGVFITLSIVLERMRYEGVVDLFQTVKMLRTQRPAMVQTEDQYQFCYRAALEYLGSFDHYAN